MKIRNSKGFTLIELLAVIVIMGILMMVAIPAMTRYIENARKDSFITTAKEYVNAVRNAWASDSLLCGSSDHTSSGMDEGNYYVLIDTTTEATEQLLDQGGKSPWGNRDLKGYVRVNITTNAKAQRVTKYYIALADGTHGIYDNVSSPTEADGLARGDVIMNLTSSANEEKRKAIMETPFETGKVTTCSTSHGNWDGSGSEGDGAGETASFADDSWETIVANVQAGNGNKYQVGSTKEIDMGSFGTHTLRVANTSTPAECSTAGFSQTACGFVLEFADIVTDYAMDIPSDGYAYGDNIGGWPATDMRSFVNNQIYNSLPVDLKGIILDTYVVSGHGPEDVSNFESTDKLYLLSSKEVGDTNVYEEDTALNQTRQLDYYKAQGATATNISVALKAEDGYVYGWWLRTPTLDTISFYDVIDEYNGNKINYYLANSDYGVSPAFRIG